MVDGQTPMQRFPMRGVTERPFTSRIRALKARDSTVEHIQDPARILTKKRVEELRKELKLVQQRKRERQQERDALKIWNEQKEARLEREKRYRMKNSEKNECINYGVGGKGITKPTLLKRSRISIKATLRARGCLIVRRFTIENGVPYLNLKRNVLNIFGARENFLLRYEDDAGDFVTVSSDNEAAELFNLVSKANLDPLVVELL